MSRFSRFCSAVGAGATAVLGWSGAALADMTTFTVPDLDTTVVESAGEKAFAIAAIVLAIGIGLRIFKRA